MGTAAILSTVALVIYLTLATYVLSRDVGAALNRVFSLVCLSLAMWSLGYAIAHQAGPQDAELYWAGYAISAVGWTNCASFLVHFFLLVTRNRWARRWWAIVLVYAPGAFFLVSNFVGHFMVREIRMTSLGWVEVVAESPYVWAFATYSQSFLVFGIAVCWRWGRRSRVPRERRQATLMVSTGIAVLAAISLFELVLPSTGLLHLPVLSPVFVLVWIVGIAVGMVKYQLMTVTPATAADEILRTMIDALVICDPDRKILTVNEAACALLGARAPELVDRPLGDVIPEIARVGERDLIAALEQAPIRNRDCVFENAAGTRIPLSMSATLIRDRDGVTAGAVAVLRDITEIKQAQDNLQHLAHHDTLTGLANRLLITDRLEQAIARAVRYKHIVGVMLLDLDRFKRVNDTHGHALGDMLLRAVAGRLSSAIRSTDSVGRLGGDEFVVVLPDLGSPQDAVSVALRILDGFRNGVTVDERALDVAPSIGIAMFPEDGRDLEALLKSADAAMYRAKAAGGNGYRFASEKGAA